MIKLINIEKSYGRVKALKGVDLEIKQGEIYLILGPNGAGKTTLMKIILGLLFPDKGQVILERKLRFGYMQEEKLAGLSWRVKKYLRFIGKVAGAEGNLKGKLDELLEEFNLIEKSKYRIRELSHGQRQRLKLIQVALIDPEVLILDEPTSGLDPLGKAQIRGWIKKEKERGKTIIITTHLLDEMEKIADKYVILARGKKLEEGEIKDLKGTSLEERFLDVVKGYENEGNI